MSNSIFHSNKIKGDTAFIYEEDYVKYLISRIIYSNPGSNEESIYLELVNKYGEDLLSRGNYKTYLNANFITDADGAYILDLEQKSAIDDILKFTSLINTLGSKQLLDLYSELYVLLLKNTSSMIEVLTYIIAIKYKTTEMHNQDYYFYQVFNSSYNLKNKDYFNKYVSDIDSSYDIYNMNIVIDDPVAFKLFAYFNVRNIKDLKLSSKKRLNQILAFNYKHYEDNFKRLKYDFNTIINKEYNNFVGNSPYNSMNILKGLIRYDSLEPDSVDKLAANLHISADKVNETKKKSLNIIHKYAEKNLWVLDLLFRTFTIKDNFVDYDELKSVLNPNASYFTMLMFQYGKVGYTYDKNYHIVYGTKISLKEIIDEELKRLPDYISKSDYKKSIYITKKLINKNYKLNGVYIRKGLTFDDFIVDNVNIMFSGNYNTSDVKCYNRLRKNIEKKYGALRSFPTQNKINSLLK